MKIKTHNIFIKLAVLFLIITLSLSFFSCGKDKTDNIYSFLESYYTIAEIPKLETPFTEDDYDRAKKKLSSYATDKLLDDLVAQRLIFMPSELSMMKSCTLKPEEISISFNNDLQEFFEYQYNVDIVASFEDGSIREFSQAGTIYISKKDDAGLVSKFSPKDRSVEKLLITLL